VLPFLTISSSLLTENLALPLLLWMVYATARTAEAPTVLNQLVALALAAALALTRLNLALSLVVLFVVVAVAELQAALAARRGGDGLRAWLRAAVRRRAVLLVALLGIVVVAALFLRSNSGVFGSYSDSTGTNQLTLIWDSRDVLEGAIATYLRSLVTGTFVFPFVLAVAGALAAMRGALGRAATLPAVAAAVMFVVLFVAVAAITRTGTLEERYVFYMYVPVALFAAAAATRVHRMPVELALAGLLTAWALSSGRARLASVSYHFFDAPGGAFWSRVVEHRLLAAEQRLPAVLIPGAPTGWRLLELALVVLLLVAVLARLAARTRPVVGAVIAGGLALCLVGQALALDYDFRSLLYGVKEAPGGFAGAPGHAADRNDWIDEALPAGQHVAYLASQLSLGGPETTEYWNRSIDNVVALPNFSSPVLASAGQGVMRPTLTGGLLAWNGPDDLWLAASADDPRAQFAGRVVKPPRSGSMVLTRLAHPIRSVWTSIGIEPDFSLIDGNTITMTVARGGQDPPVRAVDVVLRGADALAGRARWVVKGSPARPARGDLRAGRTQVVRLTVPPCRGASGCGPVSWKLKTSARRPAMVSLPVYGAPPPPRPVTMQLLRARLVR
jgi:hypothetical protein